MQKRLFDETKLRQIPQVSYLSTQKTHRYRPIIRFIYEQTVVSLHPYALPADIMGYLQQFAEFTDYTYDELLEDLDVLSERNNLIREIDQRRSENIGDYKRNKYRFKCTDETIQIERMVLGLESSLSAIKVAMERHMPGTLFTALQAFLESPVAASMSRRELETYNKLWNDLFAAFKSLTEDAGIYLSHINSEGLERMMKSERFLEFKSQFVDHLQNFVGELRLYIDKIQFLLGQVPEGEIDERIRQLIAYQKTVPRLDDLPPDEELQESYRNQWQSFMDWFVARDGKIGYANDLDRQTIEMIRKITKLAQQAAEIRDMVRNRRSDFLHLAALAHETDRLEDVQAMHSLLFGYAHAAHLRVRNEKESDRSDVSVWDLPPSEEDLKKRATPKNFERKPKTMERKSAQQAENLQAYRKEKAMEEEKMRELVARGTLVFAELERLEGFQRRILLTWIGKARLSKERIGVFEGRTDLGQAFTLHKRSEDPIDLVCRDGTLRMPDYEMIFSGGMTDGEGRV